MQLTKRSALSGKLHTREIAVTPEQLADYYEGNLGNIQKAFPLLHPDDREFIKTGITPEEWAEAFSDSDE